MHLIDHVCCEQAVKHPYPSNLFPHRSQEGVEEQFRGTVGGVQDSLNSVMETIKFLLVIILPDENSFGYLVLASVATVLLGSLFYLVYAARNWHGTKLPQGQGCQVQKI